MTTDYPGVRYEPSNGTEGADFFDRWCSRCARDRSMRDGVDVADCDDSELCPIIAAACAGEADEWRELDDGSVVCVAFVAFPTGHQRCERTHDMFGAEQTQ